MPLTVNCVVCNNEFKIKPGRIKSGGGNCCSYKCRAELSKTGEYRKCKTCDKQFYLNKTELNDGRGKYCSNDCRYANTGRNCNCLNCGAVFYRTISQLAHGWGKYCSQQCSNEGRKKRIQKICLGCNNTFSVQVGRANKAGFCSRKCRYPHINNNIGYRPRNKTGFFKNCVTCGKSIYVMPSRKDKKYCSMKCTLAKLIVCTNPKCANEYYVSQSELKKGHGRYCSKECRSKHLQTKLEVKCRNPSCNKMLNLTRYNFEHNIKKYCSKECKLSRKTGQILQCRKCGKDFYVNPSQNGVRKNCSMKCYHTGDLTPLHKKIRHLPEYFAWRKGAFERDNYRCRDCGKESRSLEVHHIKAFKTIKVQYNVQTIEDAIKCDELWDVNNGITLCRKCHLQTKNHGARKRTKYPPHINSTNILMLKSARYVS